MTKIYFSFSWKLSEIEEEPEKETVSTHNPSIQEPAAIVMPTPTPRPIPPPHIDEPDDDGKPRKKKQSPRRKK